MSVEHELSTEAEVELGTAPGSCATWTVFTLMGTPWKPSRLTTPVPKWHTLGGFVLLGPQTYCVLPYGCSELSLLPQSRDSISPLSLLGFAFFWLVPVN